MLIRIELPRKVPASRHEQIRDELTNRLITRFPGAAASIRAAEIAVCGANIERIWIVASEIPDGYAGLDFVLKTSVALLENEFEGGLKEQGTDFSMTFQPFVHA